MNRPPEPLALDARAISIVAELIERPIPEREDAIRAACGDSTLASRVRAMLAADERTGEFLDDPPILRSPDLSVPRRHGLAPGTRVARYKLTRVRGSGSMGDVYEAESPEGDRVAIKIMRPGVVSRELRRRFDFETVALSRLHHPNIAGLIESGEFESQEGPRPYLVMELVEGPTITEHAQALGLSGPDLLSLFAKVCDAAEHAHRSGVIHRDLKPANILVESASAEPKVVDFGVAREVDPAATLSTLPGHHLVGSVPYMSPEQAAGRAADTRSDVYSLGVILYELISGSPAHSPEGASLPELVRRVRDIEPPILTRPAAFARAQRDVTLVVARAMARRPEDRYPSAGQFAADLRCIVAGTQVSVRPPNLWSVALDSARRHKRRLGVAAALGSILLATAAFAITHAIDAHNAERRSDQLLEELVRGADVFVVKLNQRLRDEHQPLEARRAVLEAAREYLRRVEVQAADDPRVLEALARVYMELGRVVGGTTSGSLGQTDAAAELFETSVRMYETLLVQGDTDERRVGLAAVLEEASMMAGRPPAPEIMRKAASHLDAVADRSPPLRAPELRAHALRLRTVAAGHSGDVAGIRHLEQQLIRQCQAFPDRAEFWADLAEAQQYLAEMLAVTDRPGALRVAHACRESVTRAMSLGDARRAQNIRNLAMNDVVLAWLNAGIIPAEQLLDSAERAVDMMCNVFAEDFSNNFIRGQHVQVLMTFATAGERIANAAPAPAQSIARREIAARVSAKLREELRFAEKNRPESLVPYPREDEVLQAVDATLRRLDAIATGLDRADGPLDH